MGIVVQFTDFRNARSLADTNQSRASGLDLVAVTAALRAATSQTEVLLAAKPLLDECRDRYGFVLMCDGLSDNPMLMGRSIIELYKGLCVLDAAMGAPRTYPSFGVYLGRTKLAWFEDGYSGETGLAVPNHTNAADIASFVAPRISSRRVHSND